MVIELYRYFGVFVNSLGEISQFILFSSIAALSACGLVYCFWIFRKLIFLNDSGSMIKKAVSTVWMYSFIWILCLMFLSEHSPAEFTIMLACTLSKGGMFNIYFFYCWKSVPELRKQKLKIWQLAALLVSLVTASVDFVNFLFYVLERPALYFIEGFKEASFFQFRFWYDIFNDRPLISFLVFLAVLDGILSFLKSRLALPGFDFKKASSGIAGLAFWQFYCSFVIITAGPAFMHQHQVLLSMMLRFILPICTMCCLMYLATSNYKNKKDIWKKKIFFYGAISLLFASVVTYPYTVALISFLEFLARLML